MTDTQTLIDAAIKEREALIAKWLRAGGYRQLAMFIEREEHLK